MAKQIKVSDDTYERLKKDADANFRSMGGQIDYLMSLNGTPRQTPPTPKITELGTFVSKGQAAQTAVDDLLRTPSVRTKGDVLADIRELEAQRDEELRISQDPLYSKQITDRYAEQIQSLWNEYHECEAA